jgi:hydroxymethylpyrimidine pyrophosphatase-like HAD family hydrolase
MDAILKNRVVCEKDAVMFDIDDTLIFTNGNANVPIIKLLHYAKQLGYKIIIITARPAVRGTVEITQYQLKQYGISYDALVITPAHNKGNIKRKSGLNYVLSVGDQDTDLTDTQHALKIMIST